MALNLPHPEANWLADEVAALAGEDKTDAVILALKECLQGPRQRRQTTPDDQNPLLSQLDQIAQRCASRTILDPRSEDEILGYDDSGLPS